MTNLIACIGNSFTIVSISVLLKSYSYWEPPEATHTKRPFVFIITPVYTDAKRSQDCSNQVIWTWFRFVPTTRSLYSVDESRQNISEF